MGCTDSRLDRLPAVSLCRDRCCSLDDALRLCYSLEDAHVAYLRSLRAFGGSLKQFVSTRDALGYPGSDHEEVPKQPMRPVSPRSLGRSLSSNSSPHVRIKSDLAGYARSQSPQYSAYVQPIYDTYSNQGITTGLGSNPASPPPPPPPPSNSSWDFLNFFETYGGQELPLSSGQRLKASNSVAETATVKREAKIPTAAVATKFAAWEPATEKNRGLGEVMNEVESLFEKASNSGLTVLRLLSHSKSRQHQHRFSLYQVSFKVLNSIVPPLSKPALNAETVELSSDKVDPNEDASRNFSSILKKLHIWEKKLYAEVKAEEKLRVIYSRKCKEFKHMIENEKEVDADRIESHRMLIKNLSVQLKISLHVVDAVSDRICKLRDDKLWPCLCKLLLGWLEMWKAMEYCHQRQQEVIAEAKVSVVMIMDPKRDYGFELLEQSMQVKLDLQNIELCFCKWVTAQKNCVGALHSWLTKCLSSKLEGPSPPSQPNETVPALEVSHRWVSALDASHTMPVIEKVTELVGTIGRIYDEGYVRLHADQAAGEDKELERRARALKKKDRRMRSEVCRATRRGLMPRVGEEREPRLEEVFEAMAKYSSYCVGTYQELCELCCDNAGMV
ncbi:hypothetical protein MLD38_012821 [Melastoma candidum]|uniref:Uncharacterized protein n=1 Tax=Melastoma candidum TaxID=119954 RepID=A0ACB9R8V9_9MYRT|nr:hypothetical protein MLD38_012821 [Melastoma candidum]